MHRDDFYDAILPAGDPVFANDNVDHGHPEAVILWIIGTFGLASLGMIVAAFLI